MKAAEIILAIAAEASGLVAAAASYADRSRLGGIASGAGVVLCSAWLLLRMS